MHYHTDTFYQTVSAAFEALFGTQCPVAILEASEGDARKYMKKAIENAGLGGKLVDLYGNNWGKTAFNEIRTEFVHEGCDVYFMPGIARIAYGELDYDGYAENHNGVEQLKELVKFISTAHKGEFSRNLEHITTVQNGPQKGMKVRSKPMTLKELSDLFMRDMENTTEAQRKAFVGTPSGNGYKVIELEDFDTARQFLKYTDPGSPWCYLEDEQTFDGYRANGNRLYLALAPGFENLKPGDRGYGRSMIGFDMGPVGKDGTSKLCVCTNRYNHAENKEAVKDSETGEMVDPDTGERPKKGDAAYNEIQLSKILGVPVWKTYLGYTIGDVLKSGKFDERVASQLWDTKESILNAFSNEDALKKQYNITVSRILNGNVVLVFTDDSNFKCLVVLNGPDGVPFWGNKIVDIASSTAYVVKGENGFVILDDSGNLLNSDIYADVKTPNNCKFPLLVGKGNPYTETGYDSQRITYNYIDTKGKYLLGQWVTNAEPFVYNTYARIGIRNPDGNHGHMNVIDQSGHIILPEWARYIHYEEIDGKIFYIATMDNNSNYILDANFAPVHDIPFTDIGRLFNRFGEPSPYSFRKVKSAASGKYSIFDPVRKQYLIDWYDGVSDYISSNATGSAYVKVENNRKQQNFAELGNGLMSEIWFNGVKKLDMDFLNNVQVYLVGLSNGKVGVWSPTFGLITKEPVDHVLSIPYGTRNPYIITKNGNTVFLCDFHGNSHAATEKELENIKDNVELEREYGGDCRWL